MLIIPTLKHCLKQDEGTVKYVESDVTLDIDSAPSVKIASNFFVVMFYCIVTLLSTNIMCEMQLLFCGY